MEPRASNNENHRDGDWPKLVPHLGGKDASKALVVMEGVSPYIQTDSFVGFLRTLAANLPTGSHFAYDYKLQGVNENFGRYARTKVPFRMSREPAAIASCHAELGFRLVRCELSSELVMRRLPGLNGSGGTQVFQEDGLARFVVVGH